MKSDDIATFLEILHEIEEYRPIVQLVIDTANSFGPEVKEFLTSLSVGIADINTKTFFRYLENRLSREEALALVLNQNLTIYNALSKK